jgi:hypothetical protein
MEKFHIRDVTKFSPLDLLYFVWKFDDIKVVSELLPLFDINGIINVTLDFKRLALIEIIFKDKRFDPNQLKFKVANRWTASQLITQITRFESESPYFYHSAHELEQISELFK